MGADMIVGCFIIPDGMKIEDRLDETRKRIKILSEEHKDNIIEYFSYMGMEEGDYKDDNDNFDIEKIKEQMNEVVEDLYSIISRQNREVAYIVHKDDVIYLSGGMSYGDSPTDACSIFDRFSVLEDILPTDDTINSW